MSAANLPETVSALRAFQQASRLNSDNPNVLQNWIQRNTNESMVSDFSADSVIAILHYHNHPLYGDINNVSTEAQTWISHVQPAEAILAQEETWLDIQTTTALSTNLIRIFGSDKHWLEQWGNANNLGGVPIAYVVNYLITRLQICEGNNGPTGANGISHTPQDPPGMQEEIP